MGVYAVESVFHVAFASVKNRDAPERPGALRSVVSRVVHVICPRLFPWAGSHGFMTSAWAECHKTAGTRAQRALPTSSLFSLFLWFLHPIPCLIPIYTLVLCLALDSGCILHNPTGLSRDLRPLLLYAQTAEVCPVICSLPIFVCSSCM